MQHTAAEILRGSRGWNLRLLLRLATLQSFLALSLTSIFPARAVILWSDLGTTLVHNSGPGADIQAGAVKRDNTSSDTLYFKFHIEPLSDVSTEEYFAGFQLFQGDQERLGVGNALAAWAYSAFHASETGESNKVTGDFDLRSSRPESSGLGVFQSYELPRRGIERTIVFKVQYVPGGDDLITVWLEPQLNSGITEADQPDTLITRFRADASFDQIRLRHGGGGGGWVFSDMAIATAFSDFVPSVGEDPGRPLARAGGPASFSFRWWQREQGLPQNLVRALGQTRDGYLWVGTDDGVARFDGVRFVSFGWREGLRSGAVRTLFEDSAGSLWIGSAGGGLTREKEGQFKTFGVEDGLPSGTVSVVAEDSAGRLWAGTAVGLAFQDKHGWMSWTNTSELNGKAVTTMFKDRKGTLWVGATGAGIFRWTNGNFAAFTDPSVESLLQDPHCLLVDRGGRIWIGAGDDFLLCREDREWRRYRIPRHLSRPYITALAESPDGSIWAGSVSEGLFQFKEGRLVPISATSGMLDNFVESLLVDREGTLWVGTGAGLNQLRRKNVSTFAQDEGLGYGPVQGMAEIAPGIIWATKPSEGIYHWAGQNFSRLAAEGLPRTEPIANAVVLGRDGVCWVATGQGVLRFRNVTDVSTQGELVGLSGVNVRALSTDSAGNVWAGTEQGTLTSFHPDGSATVADLTQKHPIGVVTTDGEGGVWIGTDGGGLFRYKQKVLAHFTKGGGGLLSDFIRCLHLDKQGVLWIGTAGGGLGRLKEGQIASFTMKEGLPDDTTSQILEDDAGRLWLGSNRGIACITRQELDEVAAGKLTSVHPRVYGRAEGMLSEECTGGFSPAGLKTKQGLLWFSTLKGIVVVDPRPRTTDAPPPGVVLEEVLVDGVAVDLKKPGSLRIRPAAAGQVLAGTNKLSDLLTSPGLPGGSEAEESELRIGPGKHRVELRYTGLSFSAPERVRFRHKLEGLDADWVEAGNARTAIYSYVPPGRYRFRVIAFNGDGVANEMGAGLGLTVAPHIWQSPWFIGISALVMLVGVGAISRVAVKRKLHRRLRLIEQERALERERARIARDLHDDLGSSLTRISLLSDLAKADKDNPAQVAVHATSISQSAAHTVRALEEIVWAVRPGSDSLQSLVEYIAHFANEMYAGSGTRCLLDLPHDLPMRALPPEMRHNLFLIVKEALTNALKHAGATEVLIQAKASERSMEIIVQDNGAGFELADLAGKTHRNGVSNMRQRAETIGAKLRIESAPGKGTVVRLAVGFSTARNGQ